MIHPPQSLAEAVMRGADETSGSLFSYVDLEARIPARHPLRKIRQVVNDALASLDAEFEALHTDFGRPSIPPERLIRACLAPSLSASDLAFL
jgi:transposase